jgi:DNA-binding MarR family transcriptional regulator
MTPSPDLGIGWLLGAVHRRVRARWAERIRPLGVSPPQAAALRALAAHPGMGLRELARTIEAEPINLSRTLEPLESAGLLRRAPRPDDRRALALWPTEAGCELAQRLEVHAEAFAAELRGLLGADVGAVEAALTDWLGVLRTNVPRGPGVRAEH